MRREHFATLRPLCPVCRVAPLAITSAIRETADAIDEGILGCTNRDCLREYPIVDGIPIIVAAIRAWLAANPLQLLLRDDLSPEIESLIGDVLGPSSAFDTLRQHVSIYAAGHYESDATASLLLCGAADLGGGPILDIGCAVGGTTFALASRFKQLTLGIDLNFAMLRVAARALREGRVTYARRRVGLVYDRREVELDVDRNLVDFWCCDATALPFADATFGLAASLNVVDIVPSPREAIAECARVLRAGGSVLLATPYDWTPTATNVEQWIGGHSQRGDHRGASEPQLRALMSEHLEIVRDEERVPWRLRMHERSAVEYDVHVLVGKKRSSS